MISSKDTHTEEERRRLLLTLNELILTFGQETVFAAWFTVTAHHFGHKNAQEIITRAAANIARVN